MTNTKTLISRLTTAYIRPHVAKLGIAVICMLVVAATTGLFAHMIEPLIDDALNAKNISKLYSIALIIVGLHLLKGVASYVQAFYMEFIGQRIVADLQGDLYKHVIHQDTAFFQANPTASLSSRFIFDLHRLKNAVSNVITGAMRDVTMIVGLTANLFIKDWRLAIVSLVVFPLAMLPVRKLGRHMRRYSAKSQEETGDLNEILSETFTHHRQVKIYTMEPVEIKRALQSITNVFWLMVKTARVRAATSPLMEFIGAISLAGVVVYGGHQVASGNLTTGGFMSFLTTLMLLYRPIKGIANINNTMQEGLAAADRTFELLDQTAKVKDKPRAKKLSVKKGEITFDNVTLTYADGTTAIDQLNLTLPAGKSVALVGSSGAGKSTILNLVPRFFDPSKGTVKIDAEDISKVTLKSLREHIALVSQDVAIFDDTVAANIAYGLPNATQKQIEQASQKAAAHDFIKELPEGYATRLGENGAKLSGGQKQRIAIARAIIKNAPILLLDEATSALDTTSERQVQQALATLQKGRTTLIIAHRLSTIVNADVIHVLENGKIVESGTHADLLKAKGEYAKMWSMQGN